MRPLKHNHPHHHFVLCAVLPCYRATATATYLPCRRRCRSWLRHLSDPILFYPILLSYAPLPSRKWSAIVCAGGLTTACLTRTASTALYRDVIAAVNRCTEQGGSWNAKDLLERVSHRRRVEFRKGDEGFESTQEVRRRRVSVVSKDDSLEILLPNWRRAKEEAGTRRSCVLFMGVPGAGKTTIKKRCFSQGAGYEDIDPDIIKHEHSRFSRDLSQTNPRLDRKIHSWSVGKAVHRMRRAVDLGRNFLLDASGSDCLWLKDQIETATEQGYYVSVVYVVVPLEVALVRNAKRRKQRHSVPEDIVIEKARCIRDSFSRARRFADEVWVIINYDEKDINSNQDQKNYRQRNVS